MHSGWGESEELVTGFDNPNESGWNTLWRERLPEQFRGRLTGKPKPLTGRALWKHRAQKAWIIRRHPLQVWRFTRGVKKLEKLQLDLTEIAKKENKERMKKMGVLKPEIWKVNEESNDINDPIEGLVSFDGHSFDDSKGRDGWVKK